MICSDENYNAVRDNLNSDMERIQVWNIASSTECSCRNQMLCGSPKRRPPVLVNGSLLQEAETQKYYSYLTANCNGELN